MKITLTTGRAHGVLHELEFARRRGFPWAEPLIAMWQPEPATMTKVVVDLPVLGWRMIRDWMLTSCFNERGQRRPRRSYALKALQVITARLNEIQVHPAFSEVWAYEHSNEVLVAWWRDGRAEPVPPGIPGVLLPIHDTLNRHPITRWTFSPQSHPEQDAAHQLLGLEVDADG